MTKHVPLKITRFCIITTYRMTCFISGMKGKFILKGKKSVI